MIEMLNTTFGQQAMLWNGMVMAVKGILSFLSAPLIGALSDVWGRKVFLLVTAAFTCLPVPFIKVTMDHCSAIWLYCERTRNLAAPAIVIQSLQIHSTLYFVFLAASGVFSVIFR